MDHQLKAKELEGEIREYLIDIYKQRRCPHFLEDSVVLRKWEHFDKTGRRSYQPPKWVPIECEMPPKGSELPSSLISRIDQQEHQRLMAHGWIEPMGRGAHITVDGIVCDVWPYIPEGKESIPRKKIILAAFKPHGYIEVETGSGTLDIAKNGNGSTFNCLFDFGTWSRDIMIVMTGINVEKSIKMKLSLFCWLERGMPILTESFFRKAIENTAFCAGEIEHKYLPRILDL